MNVPYFSVVTPSWNQAAYLGKCLASVAAQGDADYEHLVFDNCSDDGSAEIARAFAGVQLRVERDRGQSHAVNKGFEAARGEIVCWLNTDDEYEPGTFGRLRAIFDQPEVNVVFGDVRQISYDGGEAVIAAGRFESRLDLLRWWSGDVKLHQPAVFFRRSVLRDTGFLREDLHYAMDYEFWWRMSERHRFHYCQSVLAIQHRQPDSKTVKAWERVLEEREKIFGSLGYLVTDRSADQMKSERRQAMSKYYLTRAYGEVKSSRAAAWRSFLAAAREQAGYALHPRSLGLVKCLLGGGER